MSDHYASDPDEPTTAELRARIADLERRNTDLEREDTRIVETCQRFEADNEALARRLAESEAAYNALNHDLTATVERETETLRKIVDGLSGSLECVMENGTEIGNSYWRNCVQTRLREARVALSACADTRKPR